MDGDEFQMKKALKGGIRVLTGGWKRTGGGGGEFTPSLFDLEKLLANS